MSSPSVKTLKQLFGLSRNRCAFPKCDVALVMDDTNVVIGELCHIKARRPEGPRYDDTQTDGDRNGFDNLVLMCPIHHKVIDEDEESYTFERLAQIKKTHEAGVVSAEDHDNVRLQFDQLLDQRIRLIIEHEKVRLEQPKSNELTSGAFALAQKLANQRKHQDKRANWFNSHEGLVQTIDSVNQILNGVLKRYQDEVDNLTTLEIKLHSEQRLRVLSNNDFGSQIELKGFDRPDCYTIPSDLRLELILFSKTPTRQAPGMFYTKAITLLSLKPDVSESLETVWKDERHLVMSSTELVEKVFELLLKQIEKERSLSKTVPDGYFRVGGRLVDAWGEPVRENDDNKWG